MSAVASVSGIDREQLITIVAHELRHPLVPIRNAAALLRHDSLDSATIRRVGEVIERQASGMNRLIGDLADLSRIQLGALELRRVHAPLAELMERVVESAGPIAFERGHVLAVSVAPDAIYLQMDVLRLDQALRHVIANMMRCAGRRGPIHVRAERNGAHAVITVSNDDMDIPTPELESSIGQSVGSAQGEGGEPGLGFGLYLARYLIEAHDGTVTAANVNSGQGSGFTVRLPCDLPGATTTAPI